MKKQVGKVVPMMEVSQTSQASAFGPSLLKISVSMSLHRVWCGLSMRGKGTWCLKESLEVIASLQCIYPMLSSYGQSCDDLTCNTAWKKLSLLPVEQPGCLAVLLLPLTFPLVLLPSLFPVHAAVQSQTSTSFLPRQPSQECQSMAV